MPDPTDLLQIPELLPHRGLLLTPLLVRIAALVAVMVLANLG